MSDIVRVKNYWENYPLYSYEIKHPLGSYEYFKEADRIRREDVDRFCMDFWNFPEAQNCQSILDIGCGPGFLTRFYATRGYKVTAIDLTKASTTLTKNSLMLFSLKANIIQSNAESLPFPDNTFDYIVSSGVLHHTPETEKAIQEACRVLKPGGKAKISLYYKNILLREYFWHLSRALIKIIGRQIPGRKNLPEAKTPDEFIRIYDGDNNPCAKGYTRKEAKALLCGPFLWVGSRISFFPLRFMPKRYIPILKPFHPFLSKYFGTMIYVDLIKDN